jgi:hypothetical protein
MNGGMNELAALKYASLFHAAMLITNFVRTCRAVELGFVDEACRKVSNAARRLERMQTLSCTTVGGKRVISEGRLRNNNLAQMRSIANADKKDDNKFPLSFMRNLFHCLDTDGSGELSHGEFQKGMRVLGFDALADPALLYAMCDDIDVDNTGSLTEREFLAYFHKLMPMSSDGNLKIALEKKIKAYKKPEFTARLMILKEKSCSYDELTIDFENKLKALPKTGQINWIDVEGYDKTSFGHIAEKFGCDEEMLAESMVFQVPSVQVHLASELELLHDNVNNFE